MLCRMAFWLSCKLVTLHLDNDTAKANFCNQGGTLSPFLSRLVCQILSLTDKHSSTLVPAHIPSHLNYLSHRWLFPEWHLLPHIAQAAIQLWVLPEVDLLDSSHTNQCQHYYTLENPLSLKASGLNPFSHPWTYQVSYVKITPAC